MPKLIDSLQSQRVGLAFSGGAVRGIAHIGVIKALEEAGIRPTVVAGTSVGSIIGAAMAAGMQWPALAEMARSVFWPRLLHGKMLEAFCAEHLPPTFEALQLPFAAVATVLPGKEAIAIKRGPLPSALSASCAVRLLRRAVVREGSRLKDGGFSCVLPATACRELGAEFIISSDVWEWSSLLRSLGHSPNSQTVSRVYPAHYRRALSQTDIHIQPKIPVRGYLPGATAVDRQIAVGEVATYRALESRVALIAA